MRSTFRLMFYINRNKVKSDGTTARNIMSGNTSDDS